MYSLDRLGIFEPVDIRFDFRTGDHGDGIPFVKPGIYRQLSPGFVYHCIIKVISEIAVDMESKIQYGRSFIDQHGGSVPAKYLDLLIVSIPGFDYDNFTQGK